jgi:hypothetical protein
MTHTYICTARVKIYVAATLYETTPIAILIHTRRVNGRLVKRIYLNITFTESATEPRDQFCTTDAQLYVIYMSVYVTQVQSPCTGVILARL